MPPTPASLDQAPSLEQQRSGVTRAFRERFGRDPEVVAVAPGRVNLIGEHVDYCDGFVLPMAIERQTMIAADRGHNGTALAGRSAGPVARFASTLTDDELTIALTEPIIPADDRGRHWGEYVRGPVSLYLEAAGIEPDDTLGMGFDALIDSTVPLGSGLSSSAALEVATATLMEWLCGSPLDPVRKALLCQRAEHEFAGVPCGIMDQFISAMGVAGSALLIDCRDHSTREVPLADPDLSVLVINSHVQHALAGGEYAERRAQTERVAEALGRLDRDWRTASMGDLDAVADDLDGQAYRRGRHVIGEIERTTLSAEAMAAGDWPAVGSMMLASHASLRDDFEVSTPELDKLVELAVGFMKRGDNGASVYGSRMTGGGFGGCTVTLVRTDRAPAVLRSILHDYREATGIEASGFVTRPAGGARILQ